jgi:hypothetical protein
MVQWGEEVAIRQRRNGLKDAKFILANRHFFPHFLIIIECHSELINRKQIFVYQRIQVKG